MWYGSKGVSIHTSLNIDLILNSIESLLQQLDPGDNILLEEYIECMHPLPSSPMLKYAGKEQLKEYGMRVRVIVCRGMNNVPRTPQVIVISYIVQCIET